MTTTVPKRHDEVPLDASVEGAPAIRTGGVEIVVPVYNEAGQLAASIERLSAYLADTFPYAATVTVVDNASTDGTLDVARRLAARLPNIRAVRLEQKGRGRAIRSVWSTSAAPVVAYMDVDLSTGLDALLPLVAPLLSGHSDLAIGSRLARGAAVTRGAKREVLSRGYNLLVRAALCSRFSDAQCGFKAMRTDVARTLLPDVVDDAWFFDTELLVRAERAGLRIHEVPVDWVDDPDSRVDIVSTVREDLKGVWRLARHRTVHPSPQLKHFARVGVLSTLAYVLLFVLLVLLLPPLAANAVALAVCTLATRAGRGRESLAGSALAFAATLGLSSGLLALCDWAFSGSGALFLQATALIAASAMVAAGRFLVLQGLAYHQHLRRREIR
jgi:glycosyltransferase involved in cell wall biosynthesis